MKHLIIFLTAITCIARQANASQDDYTWVERREMLVVGIECRTSNAFDKAPVDIPEHWARFYRENIIDQIPNKISNEIIALYCEYEADLNAPYSLVIGCQVNSISDIPDGMVVKLVPSGYYALFTAQGEHPKSLVETWKNIWQQESLKRTYICDYEIYGEKFFSGSPKEVEVYIGIK